MQQEEYVQSMLARRLVHEVHQSEMRSFWSCRRRWSWIFRDSYYPPLTPHYLEFGVAFHKALEVLHDPATWKFDHLVLGSLAEKAFVDECNAQQKEYLSYRSLYMLEDTQLEDYEARVALGRGMIWYYVKAKLPEIQKTYVPVAVESSFDVPLIDNGEYLLCKCKRCRQDFAKAGGGKWKGNPVVYSGRTDVIVHDMRGLYYALDWKSTAAFREGKEEFLSLDVQVGCVPLDSEILTKTGWKTYNQLLIGEEVLGYNNEKDCLEWTKLEDVHIYNDIETIEVSSKSFKYVTTPEHKWPKRWPDGTFRLEAITGKKQAAYIVLSATLDLPTLDINEDEAALIAWVLTDGWCTRNQGQNRKCWSASITQTKFVDEVREIVSRLNASTGEKVRNDGTYVWHLRMPYFRDLLVRAGLDFERTRISTKLEGWEQFVLGLSAKARQAFCSHAYLGDGSTSTKEFHGRNGILYSSNKKFHQALGPVNEMFRLAFFLTGKYPTVQSSDKAAESFVISDPRKWINPIKLADAGKHDVWCPQTGLGTWVMKQNRQIVITGNSYVMALRRKLGLNIQGFIYFEFRKAFPEPPKMNKQPRLGCWYSVSKTQATDHETYLATIKAEDAAGYESGAYDPFLAWLAASGPQYFRSFIEYKGDYELNEIEQNLVLQVKEMLKPELNIFPQPNEFTCSGCAFRLPCKMKNTGEDYQYTLDTLFEKREPYFRRQKKKFSTESRGGE